MTACVLKNKSQCGSPLPRESITAVTHIPSLLVFMFVCGLEPEGSAFVPIRPDSQRVTAGLFGRKKYVCKICSSRGSELSKCSHGSFPHLHLEPSPLHSLDTLQLFVASNDSLLHIPAMAAVFALTAVSSSLFVCSGLLPGFNVTGFRELSGRKVLWVFLSLAVVNALLLVAWVQLHFIPFKLQAASL